MGNLFVRYWSVLSVLNYDVSNVVASFTSVFKAYNHCSVKLDVMIIMNDESVTVLEGDNPPVLKGLSLFQPEETEKNGETCD